MIENQKIILIVSPAVVVAGLIGAGVWAGLRELRLRKISKQTAENAVKEYFSETFGEGLDEVTVNQLKEALKQAKKS